MRIDRRICRTKATKANLGDNRNLAAGFEF